MTIAFFGVSGLDILGTLDAEITTEMKKDWIEWIYAQQIHPDPLDPSEFLVSRKHVHINDIESES